MTSIITNDKTRMRILRKELGGIIDGETGKKFTPELEYKCIHCGRKFFGRELTVVHENGVQDWILCKFYPSCSGSIIDFVLVDDDEEYESIDDIPDDGYDDESSLGIIVDMRHFNKDK